MCVYSMAELRVSMRGSSPLMTHKYRGSIVILSISKSVKPNEEQKEMTSGFQRYSLQALKLSVIDNFVIR